MSGFNRLRGGERPENKPYLCITKIEVNSFGMADVKDAVGLWRKTSTYLKRNSEGEKNKNHQDHYQLTQGCNYNCFHY